MRRKQSRRVGDPLLAGVGPGAWAARADIPDMHEGHAKIVPLRLAADHGVAAAGVAAALVGVPAAMLWGLIMAFAALLPAIGPAIVSLDQFRKK